MKVVPVAVAPRIPRPSSIFVLASYRSSSKGIGVIYKYP